ncbi:hypothetical protein ACJJIW_19815 [Microbulbifer sp. JMSA004]|uniref:hypothetical protein n=1 Tax=unclassified Microbulbifer TaxID=2619833 RepID=UPI0024AE3F64|nr:hypothetical protein [Microbulbifer sp. VAAF005]WHI46677.1 hypothetical protein P0078_23750 [Microbulbifer sp. VAAF005]
MAPANLAGAIILNIPLKLFTSNELISPSLQVHPTQPIFNQFIFNQNTASKQANTATPQQHKIAISGAIFLEH